MYIAFPSGIKGVLCLFYVFSVSTGNESALGNDCMRANAICKAILLRSFRVSGQQEIRPQDVSNQDNRA
jgi:hypothetical protein